MQCSEEALHEVISSYTACQPLSSFLLHSNHMGIATELRKSVAKQFTHGQPDPQGGGGGGGGGGVITTHNVMCYNTTDHAVLV